MGCNGKLSLAYWRNAPTIHSSYQLCRSGGPLLLTHQTRKTNHRVVACRIVRLRQSFKFVSAGHYKMHAPPLDGLFHSAGNLTGMSVGVVASGVSKTRQRGQVSQILLAVLFRKFGLQSMVPGRRKKSGRNIPNACKSSSGFCGFLCITKAARG